VLHEQAHNAAQAQIGGLWLMRRDDSRRWLANCPSLGDVEIMRELPSNNKPREF